MTSEGRWYAPTCVTPGVTASGHSMSMSMNTKSASIRIKEHQLSPISINKHNQYNSMRMSMSIEKKIFSHILYMLKISKIERDGPSLSSQV